MSPDLGTVARELLDAARICAGGGGEPSPALWTRAAVLLARQALEVELRTYWSCVEQGMEDAPMRAQLLALGTSLGDTATAGRAHAVWAALSRAGHHHPYELLPTREELLAWCADVALVVERTERAWRR